MVRAGIVGRTEDLDHRLVERVVVAPSYTHGPPGIAALDLAGHADGLRLPAELLFLVGILQFEQRALLTERQYCIVHHDKGTQFFCGSRSATIQKIERRALPTRKITLSLRL